MPTEELTDEDTKRSSRIGHRFVVFYRWIRSFFAKPISVYPKKKKKNLLNTVIINDDRLEMCVVAFRTIKVLGTGTYGVVKLVQDRFSRREFAMKTSVLNPFVHDHEIEYLSALHHPNVIQIQGFFFWDTQNPSGVIYQNMLCEPLPFDLFSLLFDCRRKGKRLCDLNIKIYCFQMFRGLAYLHAKYITHRDIKPTNLLVDTDKLLLKISDFGCAKENITKTKNSPYMCSRYYRAPELVLENPIHNENIDIWAAACVVAECFTGTPIFPGRKNQQLGAICRVLGNPNKEELYKLNPNLEEDFKLRPRESKCLSSILGLPTDHLALHLLRQCFKFDAAQRPTAWQVCTHDFFDEVLERPDIEQYTFSSFETDSMPREIRLYFSKKPRCQLKRSAPWQYLQNPEWRLWNKRKKTSAMLTIIRSRARRQSEMAQQLNDQKSQPALPDIPKSRATENKNKSNTNHHAATTTPKKVLPPILETNPAILDFDDWANEEMADYELSRSSKKTNSHDKKSDKL